MTYQRETEGILSESGGEYDLVEDVAPKVPPLAKPAAPTLAYANAATPKGRTSIPLANARGAAADPDLLRRERRRDLIIPACVVGAGALIVLGVAGVMVANVGLASAGPIGAWITVNFAFDALVILASLLIAFWMLDDAFENASSAALKVSALVLGPTGVTLGLLWVDSGHAAGLVLGFALAQLLFCVLLSYLFELDFTEVATVLGVNLLVTLVANGIWLGTIGTWGYLP